MGILSQPTIPPLSPSDSLQSHTVMITGATGGIGYELSLQILQLGATDLILAVRSLQKGFAARLKMLGHFPQARIRVYVLDLSDYSSVSACAARIIREENKVDVLILNAGINLAHFEKSASGHEKVMQVNLLSNAYLSVLLLPLLALSSAPRITWVGSMGQGFHSLRATNLPSPILPHYASSANYARLSRYPDTKFFVALFCREFAAHLPKEARHVQVNNVCPGTVDTGADNALPFWLRWPMNLNRGVRGRRVEDGARAVVHAVLGDYWGKKDENGVYVANNAVSSLPALADTPEGIKLGKQLWVEVLDECKAMDAKVGETW